MCHRWKKTGVAGQDSASGNTRGRFRAYADTLHQAHGTGLVPPCKVTDKFGERSGAEEPSKQGGKELPSLWDKTLQAETHAIGSVPACTAKGVVPASTIREKHARGSVPACRITDINPETPVAICLV